MSFKLLFQLSVVSIETAGRCFIPDFFAGHALKPFFYRNQSNYSHTISTSSCASLLLHVETESMGMDNTRWYQGKVIGVEWVGYYQLVEVAS